MTTETNAKKKSANRYSYEDKLAVQRFLGSNLSRYNNPNMTWTDICREIYDVLEINMSEKVVSDLLDIECSHSGVEKKPKRPVRRKRTIKTEVVKEESAAGTVYSQLTALLMQMQNLLGGTLTPTNTSTDTNK